MKLITDEQFKALREIVARSAEHEDALSILDGLKDADGWLNGAPTVSGRFLATDGKEVREGRWMPKKRVWKFPSAQAGLALVIAYRTLPEPPRVASLVKKAGE